jgi:hypothetical protein
VLHTLNFHKHRKKKEEEKTFELLLLVVFNIFVLNTFFSINVSYH